MWLHSRTLPSQRADEWKEEKEKKKKNHDPEVSPNVWMRNLKFRSRNRRPNKKRTGWSRRVEKIKMWLPQLQAGQNWVQVKVVFLKSEFFFNPAGFEKDLVGGC